MPIYEYRCSQCEDKFELRRGFSAADAPAACPHCGHTGARRLVSQFASFSKGDGGTTTAIGGGGCGSCAGGSCATCGH